MSTDEQINAPVDDEQPDDEQPVPRMHWRVTITMSDCEAGWLAGLVERTRFGDLTGNVWEAQMLDGALRAIKAGRRRECERREHGREAL